MKRISVESWLEFIVQSYSDIFKKSLIKTENNYWNEIFNSDFYLVAHELSDDPILVYGNQKVLNRWEMEWEEFVGTPSRFTAEENLRLERTKILNSTNQKGYYKGYNGIRISKSGKRFMIKDVTLFNVYDNKKNKIGQAALFYETEEL